MSCLLVVEGKVQRDMDLIRDSMLKIERAENVFEVTSNEAAACLVMDPTGVRREDAAKLRGHLELLEDAGFAIIQIREAEGPS